MNIISDMHTHTLVSHHAYCTVMEICRQANELGLEAVAITDHAYGMPDAANKWHFGGMWVIPRKLHNVFVFRGAEANIMNYDGIIDLTASDINKLDYVIASLHTYCLSPGSIDDHTRAYENVINNSDIDTIGHPGEIEFPFDYDYIVSLCAKKGVNIELNTHAIYKSPESMQNYRRLAELCTKHGTNIVVASDAHFVTEIGNFAIVLDMLDSIGFSPDLVINSNLVKLIDYINSKKKVVDKFKM